LRQEILIPFAFLAYSGPSFVKQNLEPARGISAFRSLCSLQVGHSPFQCSCPSHFKTGLSSIPRSPALLKIGAGERNRTPDKLITNQLLYQLSYAGPIIVLPGVASRPLKPPAASLCEATRRGRRRKLRRHIGRLHMANSK
jgi:hypothetical protein